MESALSAINVTFDGNEVLNKIKACLNDASCSSKLSQPAADHLPLDLSFERLRDSVSKLINNQSDGLTGADYHAQLDVPFLKFDALSIAGICLAYALIIVVSLLGNVLVCYVIVSRVEVQINHISLF